MNKNKMIKLIDNIKLYNQAKDTNKIKKLIREQARESGNNN